MQKCLASYCGRCSTAWSFEDPQRHGYNTCPIVSRGRGGPTGAAAGRGGLTGAAAGRGGRGGRAINAYQSNTQKGFWCHSFQWNKLSAGDKKKAIEFYHINPTKDIF